MLREYLKLKINLIKSCRFFKNEKGLTLVEVVIAFLVLALVTTVTVQGVMISIRANEINRAKTEAIALANTELEDIRLMSYSNIGIVGATGSDPEGNLEPVSIVDYNGTNFTVNRSVTWVDGEYSYKQIEVSAVTDDMEVPISVVTQLYPEFGEGGPPPADYPPVDDLTISGGGIFIIWLYTLDWSAPEAANTIDYYEIHRDSGLRGTSNITRYADSFFEFGYRRHTYYVIVVYDDGTKSDPSNVVSTDDA